MGVALSVVDGGITLIWLVLDGSMNTLLRMSRSTT